MISSLQLVAFASENNVRIEEMELSLSVPNSYSIINDNTPANDSVFEKIGVTKSELLTQFKEKNIYLNCISQNNNEEIVVTMTPNSISDFNLLSDTSGIVLFETFGYIRLKPFRQFFSIPCHYW